MSEDKFDFLAYKHPLYQLYIKDVAMYKSCYLNKGFINEETLPKFSLELKKDYDIRKKRAFHINLFHHLINIPIQAIFSDKIPIQRTFPSKYKNLKEYETNINGNGKHINKLMSELTVRSLSAKQSYAYIENPNGNQGKPRVIPLWFDSVFNWNLDNVGEYDWIMTSGSIYSQPDPKKEAQTAKIVNIIYKEGWEQYNIEDDKIISSGINASGIVPIVKVLITDEDDDGIGEGWGDKLVKFDIELLNTNSLYQLELYLLLFNVLTLQCDSPEQGAKHLTNLSEHNALTYEKGANAPAYLSPGIETLQEKKDHMAWIINTCRMIAGFKGKDEAVEKAQSGIAKLLDLHNTSETVALISKAIQNAEYKIWYYLAICNDMIKVDKVSLEDFSKDITIQYPTDFSSLDADAVFDKLERTLSLSLSNVEASNKIEEKLVKSLLKDNITDEEMEVIEEGYKDTEKINQNKIGNEITNNIKNNEGV